MEARIGPVLEQYGLFPLVGRWLGIYGGVWNNTVAILSLGVIDSVLFLDISIGHPDLSLANLVLFSGNVP